MKPVSLQLLSFLLAGSVLCMPGCSAPPSGGMRPSAPATKSNNGGDTAGKSGLSAGAQGGSGSDSDSSAASEASITVSAEQQQLGGIRIATLEPRAVPRTLSVPGQIMMDEQRTAHIASYADGRVVSVLKLPGEFVERGTVLARLHSHSVHETAGALAMNFANLDRQRAALVYAQAKRDRYAHLYSIQAASLEQQQTSEQELVAAQTDLANAQAAVTMEREHLGDLIQVPPESITPTNLYSFELVPIESPIAGTVITRSITPGSVLEPGQEAFTVANLGEVWMLASVNETGLSHLRLGQRATVRTDAWPGETFTGHVTLIGSSLDPATRTVQVRISLANPQNKLKPQMFSTAVLDEADTREALFVPENALQDVNGIQVAFVTTDGTHFTARTLKTAAPVSGMVEVTEGLRAGERIAIAGTFMLKSELLKSTMDSE